MKNIIVIVFVLLFAVSIFAGGVVITEFTVNAVGDQALLQWTSGIEGNLTKYKIERSVDGQTFFYINETLPAGNNHVYIFYDDTLFKDSSQRLYYYRIKMTFSDGSFSYSEVKSVQVSFSGLAETWGSIKAMFR